MALGNRPDQADDARVDPARFEVFARDLVEDRQVLPLDRRDHHVGQRQRPLDPLRLALAFEQLGLVEYSLDVPLGLVVAEEAGGETATRPDQARQGGCRVVGVGVDETPVAVAVDGEALPLAGVEPERPCPLQHLRLHGAAEVRLETGHRGQCPDAAAAEVVAGGGALEGIEVLGRDPFAPALGGGCS